MSKYASLINYINEDNTVPADIEMGTSKPQDITKTSETTA